MNILPRFALIFLELSFSPVSAQTLTQPEVGIDRTEAPWRLYDYGASAATRGLIGTIDPATGAFRMPFADLGLSGASSPSGPAFNLVAFGADATGATDSCRAVQQAATALAASAVGGYIEVPAGKFLSSCRWNFKNMNVTISGPSQGVSRVVFSTPGDAGITVVEESVAYHVNISHLQIIANGALGKDTAISVAYPNSIGSDQTVTIHDNIIQNGGVVGNPSAYFGRGIYCTSCLAFTIADNLIAGRNEALINGTGALAPSGITVGGNMGPCVELGGYSSNGFAHGNNCGFADKAFYIHGDSEGQRIYANNGVAVNYGVYNDDKDTSGDPTADAYFPAPEVMFNHFDTFYGGVVNKGWSDGIYSNNLLYKRTESTQTWYGYDFKLGLYNGAPLGALTNQVDGGLCRANSTHASAANTYCVHTDWLSQHNTIQDVKFYGMSYFASSDASVIYQKSVESCKGENYFLQNVAIEGGGKYSAYFGWFYNLCSSNHADGNKPMIVGSETLNTTLAVNSNMPSVGGTNSPNFVTANTAVTTITTFQNGYIGETIIVTINDTKTSFSQNANLRLARGTAVGHGLQPGEIFTFQNIGKGVWREITRSN